MFSITLIIVIATCIVSISAFSKEKLKDDLLFWPALVDERRQYYRFITYGFVHADYMHLAFNMISLYSFGEYMEQDERMFPALFGGNARVMFIALYFLGLIISTIPDYFYHRRNYTYRALGASGAVSAVIFSYILLNPTEGIRVFFLPSMPAYLYGVIFIVLSIWMNKRGNDNIGHIAHISGAVFGLLFTIITCKIFAGYNVVEAFINMIRHH